MKHYFFEKFPKFLLLCLILTRSYSFASDLFIVKKQLKDQITELDATIEAIDKATLSAQTSGHVQLLWKF